MCLYRACHNLITTYIILLLLIAIAEGQYLLHPQFTPIIDDTVYFLLKKVKMFLNINHSVINGILF